MDVFLEYMRTAKRVAGLRDEIIKRVRKLARGAQTAFNRGRFSAWMDEQNLRLQYRRGSPFDPLYEDYLVNDEGVWRWNESEKCWERIERLPRDVEGRVRKLEESVKARLDRIRIAEESLAKLLAILRLVT